MGQSSALEWTQTRNIGGHRDGYLYYFMSSPSKIFREIFSLRHNSLILIPPGWTQPELHIQKWKRNCTGRPLIVTQEGQSLDNTWTWSWPLLGPSVSVELQKCKCWNQDYASWLCRLYAAYALNPEIHPRRWSKVGWGSKFPWWQFLVGRIPWVGF